MNQQVEVTEAAKTAGVHQAVDKPGEIRQDIRTISHPREVAAVVMAQMNIVSARKDELTIAIKGLTDLTQQLARAYTGQVQLIEQLVNRVKVLEEAADDNGRNGHAATPGTHTA